MAETPVLQVEHLTMRYGEGCPHCKDHLEKNRYRLRHCLGSK